MSIDFIGVGAQKSGTSWAYACLYEHPEICAPVKEIHFFSRPRFEKGREWYEAHFKRCKNGLQQGEFSTSYLYSHEAPKRIHELYPDAKLVAILRDPVTRARSQYKNAIKAGEIADTVSFADFVEHEESVVGQGRYYEQLKRYLDLFPRDQMLILVYEDIEKDPQAFMETIYTFLGVDVTFVPSMLSTKINVERKPKRVWVERWMRNTAEYLRRHGLDRLVWSVKKSGMTDRVRSMNTEKQTASTSTGGEDTLRELFQEDVAELSKLLGRDLSAEWK